MGERRDRVFHLHALERRPGAQTDTGFVGADGGDDGLRYRGGEAGAVFDAAAPGVGAFVAYVLDREKEGLAWVSGGY